MPNTEVDAVGPATASISVSSNETILGTITPANSSTTVVDNIGINVAVTNSKGYHLTLHSKTADTNMRHSDSSVTNTISSATSSLALNNFIDNTWGYCFGNTACSANDIFNPLTPSGSDITLINTTFASNIYTANDTYYLTFGTKTDFSLPPGEYSNTQVISLTADDISTRTLADITYMQEMTSEICATTATPSSTDTNVPTKQLIDIRDNKKYWVSKLADGNCWMTQNLALDLSTTTALTPDNTDISTNWTPTSNTLTSVSDFSDAGNIVLSWNLGEYIPNNPGGNTNICSYRKATIPQCNRVANITNVSGWNDTFISTPSGSSITAFDTSNQTYDAHYLLGNYYTWTAATAGTGTDMNTQRATATGSICPKGWHLPDGGLADNAAIGILLNAYGITTKNAAAQSPIYLAPSGYVDRQTDAVGIYRVGAYGYYWTRTNFSINTSYYVRFNSSSIGGGTNTSNRYYGMTVRCLAN